MFANCLVPFESLMDIRVSVASIRSEVIFWVKTISYVFGDPSGTLQFNMISELFSLFLEISKSVILIGGMMSFTLGIPP